MRVRAITYAALALFGVASWAVLITLARHAGPWFTLAVAWMREPDTLHWLLPVVAITVGLTLFIACACEVLPEAVYTPKRYRETPYVCGATPIELAEEGDDEYAAPSFSGPAAKGFQKAVRS